ncbi:MAG: DMT family transporter [Gemmatimonadota bacterium]
MHDSSVQTQSSSPLTRRSARRIGYSMALGAGILWGTTGPLSTALYAEGAALTAVGFWRVLLGGVALGLWGLKHPELFRVDRRGVVLVGLFGGICVAGFEVAYQFAIAGVGVAGAAALLYTAPVIVAIAARLVLGEALTPLRLVLAFGVMLGAALTVRGGSGVETLFSSERQGVVLGVAGGLIAAASYAGTTLIARYAVPRYGPERVLFLEIAGATVLLAVLLPAIGETPVPPTGAGAWVYMGLLAAGTVLAANFLFFGALRRVEAAPVSVAATIEPVAGAVLAFALLGQDLSAMGWAGLLLVVASVAAGYVREGLRASPRPEPQSDPRAVER